VGSLHGLAPSQSAEVEWPGLDRNRDQPEQARLEWGVGPEEGTLAESHQLGLAEQGESGIRPRALMKRRVTHADVEWTAIEDEEYGQHEAA
jgi:hypothetical protein